MISQAWGKCDPNAGVFHPLVDHCLDVAVVFQALVRKQTFFRRLSLTLQQQERLCVLAFLHDFGKCNRGFQAKIDPRAWETAGHVMEALAFLSDGDPRLQPTRWRALMERIIDWFANPWQAEQMLIASVSHHGRPVSRYDIERWLADSAHAEHLRWWQRSADYDPLVALDELAGAACGAFPEAFKQDIPRMDATPEFQHRFAGLLMLADWIGSDTQFFPYRQGSQEDRLVFAKAAAQRALERIGLVLPEPRQSKPFTEVFPFAPTPLQKALAESVELSDATRLLLVESDTGSGKTEAALAWWMRLYVEDKVDGLYFALPTRVAAREIYARVFKAVESAFEPGQQPRPVLLAVPGYVKANGEPLLPDPAGTLWDDNARDLRRERLWSAERPKRFLAAPVAVGTIDQALLSVLQVKHSLMRSVCLDRHLLVVDEVHASDPYMRELLKGLLGGHLARGGWALLLSATLGETAAAAFFGREPVALDAAMARPYPLISSHGRVWPMPAARARRIEIECTPTLEDDEAVIPALLKALEADARVLVVCNTVRRANALFRNLETALKADDQKLSPVLFTVNGVPCPHHGRFAREDREAMDAAVTAQLGKGSPNGAKILIGTQTLEQSLDIDADWLVTDLAPMDVLIQRFGRLHRHDRKSRPKGFECPRALIRTPAKALSDYLGRNGELKGPAGLGTVYPDGRVLAATLELLGVHPQLLLPQQARELIERATHATALEALPEVWKKHRDFLEGEQLAEILQAVRSLLELKPFGELHYSDKGERVLTRLGESTFDLPLAEPMPSPFGGRIRRVPIPARWLEGAEPPEVVSAEATEEGFRVRIGERAFSYTRFGLERVHVRPAG